MFTVVKVLNNNIVLALTDTQNEVVVFGTGIGFKKKKGDTLDESAVSKTFYSDQTSPLESQLAAIPTDILLLTEKIIHMGEEILNKKLGSSMLFSLSDHLTFSIQRHQEKMEYENPIVWEIPHLYFQEYQIGKKALKIIQKMMGISFEDTEASLIALHFVNAQIDGQSMGDTIKMTHLTKEIVKIIQNIFEMVLDKSSIDYSRFITHLRYFIVRQETNQPPQQMDDSLKELIQDRYMKSYACGLIIKEMLKREFNWNVTEDELVFLVIHIERITKKHQQNT
ncbi:PRD domain-containing protein [Bacillus safensis]|nr:MULTISPECIES: PRD domain-containing protein [Bacillus]MCY7587614.1 PRD domain-containing protein [Bacillus safensis]